MIIDYDIGRRGGLLFAEFGNAFSRSSSVGNKAAVRREGPVPPCRALLGGVRSRDEKPLPAEEANERDVLSLSLSLSAPILAALADVAVASFSRKRKKRNTSVGEEIEVDRKIVRIRPFLTRLTHSCQVSRSGRELTSPLPSRSRNTAIKPGDTS